MPSIDQPPAAQFQHDQQLLDQLQSQPLSDAGLTVCCRLIMRYENTGPRSSELAKQAQALLLQWGLDRRSAFFKARKLWSSGYRPTLEDDLVGSGADAAAAN